MKNALAHLVVAVGLVTLPLGLAAKVTGAIDDPAILATVDGDPIPTKSVDLMLGVLSRDNPSLNRAQLVNGIIENRLFAEEARREMSDDEIWETTRVGYPAHVTLEKQHVSLLRAAFHDRLQHDVEAMGGDLLSLYTRQPAITAERFEALSRLSNKVAYQLSADQEALAKDTEVAAYKLPSGETGTLTFWDLYSRENVQGRAQLHQGKRELLPQLAHARLQQLFIQDWARHRSGLTDTEYQALEDFVTHKFMKLRYLQHKGLWTDIHDDNWALKAEARNVSQDDIEDYYDANRDEFRQVQTATAYHITTATHEDAVRALKALQSGMSDQAAIKRFSIAEDRNNQPPGQIGPLHRREGVHHWLNSIAFALDENQWSRPLRSPQTKGDKVVWELVKVIDRTEGYEPRDSETVRYLASRKIAMDRIESRFKERKKALFEAATIQLNRKALREPGSPARTASAAPPRHDAHDHAH